MQQLLLEEKNVFILCSTGDRIAFKKLFDKYRGKIYATSYQLTKSEYASEEVVQEVFMDLWEGRHNLKYVDNPSGYIFKIVYTKIYRYFKKSKNNRQVLKDWAQRIKVDEHNETERQIDFNEVQNFINQAIDKLPPRRKLIYKLSREQGLNNQQITEHLNNEISPLTVKKHLMLALNDLRMSLLKFYCV